jgi:hypothetical protein
LSEVLDWREQFSRNPVVWGAGAVSVGILIGLGLAHTFEETRRAGGRGKSDGAALGAHLIGEVSGLADAVLPTLSGKVKEMFGIDLSRYLPAPPEEKTAEKRHRKKRAAVKKRAVKKRGPRKSHSG